MKKITPIIISVAIILCVAFCFAGCAGNSDKHELTLKQNIADAGTISGEGKYNYDEDLYIVAEAKSGYYFLGWYHEDDLLSTSAKYNCKMWDKDVTLEAKFTVLPADYDENANGSNSSNNDIVNQTYSLHIRSATPNFGEISINGGDYITKYETNKTTGANVRALALTKSEKRFLGWFDEAGNQITANAIFEFGMPCFDYTLLAKWECDGEYKYYSSTREYKCETCGDEYEAIPDDDGFLVVGLGNKKTLVEYIGNASSITIPSNVSVIGNGAFKECNKLENVIIPNSVNTIGSEAFHGCSSLESIEIPNSVNAIGYEAFYGCSSLTNIKMSNSIKSISSDVFYGCSSLERVEYSGTIEEWCSIAFSNASSNPLNNGRTSLYINGKLITDLILHDGLTEIKSYAFSGCTFIKNVHIPNSIEKIENSAFFACSSIESLTLPVFYDALEGHPIGYIFGNDEYDGGVETEQSKDGYLRGTYYIPNSLATVTVTNGAICKNFFEHCSSLASVTILDGVTAIDEEAFVGCSSLKNITIPNTVTTIEGSAFYNCISLENITIPNSVTTISEYLFYNCASLKSVTIPNGVTEIKGFAFYDCKNLTRIIIPNTVTKIGQDAFANCTSLKRMSIPDSVMTIGDYAFSGCNSLTIYAETHTWPDGWLFDSTAVYDIVFGVSGINVSENGIEWIETNGEIIVNSYLGAETTLEIPALINGMPVTKIEEYAFSRCSSLESVTLPNSITSIGKSAFSSCTSLKSVIIPNEVYEIGDSAFSGCSSLESVTIPNSVITLGKSVFTSCDALKEINYLGTIQQWCGRFSFYNYDSNPLHNGTDLYLNGKLVENLVIPNNITQMYDYAFAGCTSIKSVTIESTVISTGAFKNCTSLQSVTIEDKLKSISDLAFEGCVSLNDVKIGNNVNYIGTSAFEGCTSLERIVIPENVTKIKDYAFMDCDSLTIYCEVLYSGVDWSWAWNYSDCSVVWGYNE